MTDLQNKYDILLEDIKLLLQYDDKYMKIGKTKLVKPNILNELEKKISDIKQKKTDITLQIKDNNDKKKLLTNDISSITIQNTNIETEISELTNNTKIIQEEQKSKLDLINSKCKELEEFSNTIKNELYKDIIKQILKVCSYNHTLLSKNIFNKLLNNHLIDIYINYKSYPLFIKHYKEEILNLKDINQQTERDINSFIGNLCSTFQSHHNSSRLRIKSQEDFIIENNKTIINYRKIIKDNNTNILNLDNTISIMTSKCYIIDNMSINTINNILAETQNLQDIKYKSNEIFSSLNDKLLFIKHYIIDIKIPLFCNLEIYNFVGSNYERIINLQKKINDFNIKLSLINNTDIDVNYIKELNKQNIEIEEYDNNYLNLIITYEIKINKLKKTILELEEMESEISNQIKDNNNKEKTIDIIEQHMRLTKLQKNLKKEIKDNKAKKSKLEINSKKECDIGNFDYKNEYIKHITESQSYYLSEFTNLIKQILNKNIEQITIDKLNIYDTELKQSKDILEHIMLLYKPINDIEIDVNTYNSSNIKNIQTSIQKEIELNTNRSKNIDIIKYKNDEIQKILSLNTNLNLEIDKYNIEIFKLEDEFTTIEKVYNLRKLYTS